jgi:hypothetical protein
MIIIFRSLYIFSIHARDDSSIYVWFLVRKKKNENLTKKHEKLGGTPAANCMVHFGPSETSRNQIYGWKF